MTLCRSCGEASPDQEGFLVTRFRKLRPFGEESREPFKGDPMEKYAVQLEEKRLQGTLSVQDYPDFHERHGSFLQSLKTDNTKRYLIWQQEWGALPREFRRIIRQIYCATISPPRVLTILQQLGLRTVSFDLDDDERPYPFPDGHFDAIVSLATIEHLRHVDYYLRETHRILNSDGCLYLSAPNYAGLAYLPRFVLSGKTFHDPLSKSARPRYEFYAHVRYFTYRTLLEYVSSFGFIPDTVYLALPGGSFQLSGVVRSLQAQGAGISICDDAHVPSAFPRWASEPILCFRKTGSKVDRKFRKVIL